MISIKPYLATLTKGCRDLLDASNDRLMQMITGGALPWLDKDDEEDVFDVLNFHELVQDQVK